MREAVATIRTPLRPSRRALSPSASTSAEAQSSSGARSSRRSGSAVAGESSTSWALTGSSAEALARAAATTRAECEGSNTPSCRAAGPGTRPRRCRRGRVDAGSKDRRRRARSYGCRPGTPWRGQGPGSGAGLRPPCARARSRGPERRRTRPCASEPNTPPTSSLTLMLEIVRPSQKSWLAVTAPSISGSDVPASWRPARRPPTPAR